MEVKLEIGLTEVEILRVNPQPGEVLVFKLKGEGFEDSDAHNMGSQLRLLFPKNKVICMTLPPEHEVELTVVQNQGNVESTSDCSEPEKYCNDCSCGKKERIESERNEK
jgi:hypothetical protein